MVEEEVEATSPVPASTTTTSPVSTSTRRANRIISRRRQTTIAVTTNATTQATTKLFEDEESLQDIDDTDAIEDPSLESRKGKASFKVQRRPLILKDQTSDQNPSATNEDENKRQSKKYSASIKQNQLDDLVKKSQEETSAEKKTTVEDISPETAVALAAHQLITAPIPIVTDFEDDDVKPTRNGQTTVEYKYTSREYNEFTDTDSKTPTYDDYQSTPLYKTNTVGNDETTPYKTQIEFDSSKISDFDSTKTDFDNSKTTSEKYSTPDYKTIDYIQTTSSQSYPDDIDSSRISTYNVPKSTNFLNTASTVSNQDYSLTTSTDYSESDYKSPVVTSTAYTSRSPSTNTATGRYFSTTDGDSYTTGPNDFDSTLLGYISKSDYNSDAVTKNYIRSNTDPETSTEFASRNSPYLPNYVSTTYSNSETLDDTVLEENLSRSRISTTLSPPPSRQDFERTTLAGNAARVPSGFTPRVTESKRLRNDINREPNAVTAGYSFIQRGSNKFRNDRLLPVDNSGFSTIGYARSSQDPSYYTREYLLESPVTKSYDEEYQYISPVTTTPAPPLTRRVIRKKIQRKISTTLRPTTPQPLTPTTTVKPRRVPAKPFEKVSKVQNKTYRPIANYDYYDDSDEKVAVKYVEGTKVVMHDNGTIECLDIGNFPHPTSCKKFISCARIDNGSLLGWEYICPKGLSFDPVGGICNWSAGLGCNEKDT